MSVEQIQVSAEGARVPESSVGDVYRDILHFSAALPRWQNELLRRVLLGKGLTTGELNELAEAAVAETEQQASEYALLCGDDLPSVAATEEHRLLVAVKEVRNVNALRADQSLTFGPQLTVVYGDNAAGKSGYCRVLKKVYRARVVDDILGDVRTEAAASGPSTALFVVKTPMGDELVHRWVDGSAVSNAGRFAVLDGACSLTYVRGGTLAVGPAGIDVLDRFATELDRLKHHLADTAAAAQPSKKGLQDLENDTDAGRFIRSLSSATSDESITSLATFAAEHDAELQRLEAAVAAGKASSPSARRLVVKANWDALRSLGDRLTTWLGLVSDERAAELRAALVAGKEADSALEGLQSLGDESVPAERLKGSAWVAMLRAATTFIESLDSASNAEVLAVDGRCVLCWQELDELAKSRLLRFQSHLEGAAQTAKRQALSKRNDLVSRIEGVPQSLSSQDEALVALVDRLPDRLRTLVAAIAASRNQILASMQSGDWSPLVAIDAQAVEEVRALSAAVDMEFAALPANDALAIEQLVALERDRLELATRKALTRLAGDVRDFVTSTRDYQRLKAAENAINTRAVSKKAGELHAKHMTERYAQLVEEELKALRFQRQKPVLAQKTNKAKVEVTPLVSAEMKHLSAEKVFSEGERTAIAMACFLAELRLGNDPSGLIFDDPVSSLDHSVREHVAHRLVAAAKERQVVVFTHDLAFLADLREQAKKIQSVDCQFRTLTATEYDAGFVEEEEPFGARSISKRIRFLKNLLVAAETTARNGELAQFRVNARDFYDRLRSTWERFIEEKLFAQVVQRLERNVVPGALAKVLYTPDLAEQVHEGWRRCSAVIEAHDHAPAAGQQSYSVEEMKQDLLRLLNADEVAKKAEATA